MAAQGFSQRWKSHLPGKHSKRVSSWTTKDSERGKKEREARRGPHNSVTMAATSRYLTDKEYVMRKPLFSADEHTSILKKTHPQNPTEQKKLLGEYAEMKFLTRPRKALIPESFNLNDSDVLPYLASGKDLDSPLGASEFQVRLCNQEPTLRSPFPDSRTAEQSLSSSFLEVPRIKPPLRPQLTSTVLYPTYTPRSEYSRPGHTHLRLGGREGRDGWETKSCSLKGHSEGGPEFPYQANYWACAIPKASPPSPDRHSAGWDPNEEYQTLLDYTYPLRPGQVFSKRDSFKLQAASLLQTDPNLQDSGIELNHLCSSTSLSGLEFSISGTSLTRKRSTHSVGPRSPELQDFTRSSDGLPSSSHLSLMDSVTLSLDSLDRGTTNCNKNDGRYHQRHVLSSSHSIPTAFIHSTSVLSQSGCVCREVDEEFWPLPEQLEELQLLSKQVRKVTVLLNQPVTASWESLEPGTTSILSSIDLSRKHGAEEADEAEVKEDKDEEKKWGIEQMSAAQTGLKSSTADHRGSKTRRSSFGAWVEPAGGELSTSSLKEVEALVKRLCGLTLPDRQKISQEDQEQSNSLMQHIQVFCSHLELLIQQLYAVSEKMELLTTGTEDTDRVKPSLAEYECFQKEVSSHQPLTSCVLHTGKLLLNCINTTSPLLRDSLMLIERQSIALQNHTKHFSSCILSAMESLTQQNTEDGPVEVQGSTL